MKSTIIELYDYKQIVPPSDMLVWRVSDEEIAQKLELLGRNHAYESEADEVMNGDSVSCRGESSSKRWNREVLLFYPGRGLCAPELENACIGAKLGETRTVRADGSEVWLTVQRIIRRSNMPICDELIKMEHIPGVDTVEKYKRWYRETTESTNKQKAAHRAASYLLDEITANSRFILDPDEKDMWLRDRVDAIYNAMVEAGMDPKIPDEGFDFLTEEQAKEKLYRQFDLLFTRYVACAYLAEMMTGRSFDDICAERLNGLAAENHTTCEELTQQTGRSLVYEKIAYEYVLNKLSQYAKDFLEE